MGTRRKIAILTTMRLILALWFSFYDYRGDDKHFSGEPLIENGVVTGYLNIHGPFLPENMNFWSYAYTSWSEYGNNELYYKLDRGIQEIFRKQLLQGYVGSQIEQGFPDFIDGLLTGATLTNYGGVRSSLGFSKKGGKQKEGNQHKGTPRNNQAQNKQVNDIVSKYKLNRQQQRELHDEITGQNYDYHTIEQIAKEIVKSGK